VFIRCYLPVGMCSPKFLEHFLVSICALPLDTPPVVVLAAEGLTGVHDFLSMYEDCEHDDYLYSIYDPDGWVTTYILDVNYCHILRSLHKWLFQLVLENGPAILQDFWNRKFCRNNFEFFLQKAHTIHTLPTFHFSILDTLPSRVVSTYATVHLPVTVPSGPNIFTICPEGGN